MPLPTPTPTRCGWCHNGPCLLTSPPPLLCGEGGAAPHDVPASLVVEFKVDLSGRGDYENGDVVEERAYTCSHPSHIASAEHRATDAGLHVETRPLQVTDYEDATGYLLAAVTA